MEIFHRQQLARQLATQVLATHATAASSSGVFLAAPRRTGKSTFLREDLSPQLEAMGAIVVYTDLWEDRKADPGDVIVNAVRAELAKHDGVIAKLARTAGVSKLNVGGAVSFDLAQVGLGSGVSLSIALSELSDEVEKPIVLVIDEAQQAITSDSGQNALFALKAARDHVNSSQHHGLRVVATGSNRDKLAMLRASRDQAFFGAPLIDFPVLGEGYVAWFCAQSGLPGELDPKAVFELFKRALFRPEVLGAAADSLRYKFDLAAEDVPRRFAEEVEEQIESGNAELLRIVHSLTPLQSAVLRVLAARRKAFAPFEAQTMAAYQEVLAKLDGDGSRADVPGVQQALSALQEKALVWRASRGVYDLEESALGELMAQSGLLQVVPDSASSAARNPGVPRESR